MKGRRYQHFVLLVGFLAASAIPLSAQGIFATLTGVVSDPSGSVIPNARIVLTDALSGSTRQTMSNGQGYYTFASVPVGSYNLSVDAKGFKNFKASGITLGGGEQRNMNVQLAVGQATEQVEVSAANEGIDIATTDSGEKAFALTTKELQNFTQVGSNAAMRPSSSKSRRVSESRMARRTSRITTARPSESTPTAIPAAKAR